MHVIYIGGIITSWRRLQAICNNTLLNVSMTSVHTLVLLLLLLLLARHVRCQYVTTDVFHFVAGRRHEKNASKRDISRNIIIYTKRLLLFISSCQPWGGGWLLLGYLCLSVCLFVISFCKQDISKSKWTRLFAQTQKQRMEEKKTDGQICTQH